MPATIVLDHAHPHRIWRLWRRVSILAGSVLLAAGTVAALAVLLLLIFVLGLDGLEAPQVSGKIVPAFAVALVGLTAGPRLIRGKRRLVLFLRHFGYTEATHTMTLAATQATGRTWRLVTLDDAAIAPVGVSFAPATRGLFRAVALVGKVVRGAAGFVMNTGVVAIWVGVITGLVAMVVILQQRHQDITGLALLELILGALVRQGEFSNVSVLGGQWQWDAVHLLVAAVDIVALGGALLFAALGFMTVVSLLFMTVRGVYGAASGSVQQAEASKAAQINRETEIRPVGRRLLRESRRIFSPRLVVLKVDSRLWKEAVLYLASIASLTIIDVSEPGESLLWEITELTGRLRARCLFVANYDTARMLGPQARAGQSPPSLAGRLETLLDGAEILAYTTDRSGVDRFSRALRAMLLTRSQRHEWTAS